MHCHPHTITLTKAFEQDAFISALRDIYRSMKHDVMVIVSEDQYKKRGRKKLIAEFFDIVEGPTSVLSFKGSGFTDSLRLLRLSRRVHIKHYVQPAPPHALIHLMAPDDDYDNARRHWHTMLEERLQCLQDGYKKDRASKRIRVTP